MYLQLRVVAVSRRQEVCVLLVKQIDMLISYGSVRRSLSDCRLFALILANVDFEGGAVCVDVLKVICDCDDSMMHDA